MIWVTLMNHSRIAINSHLIETIEEVPDTIITLTTGKKIIVREKADDLVNRITGQREV